MMPPPETFCQPKTQVATAKKSPGAMNAFIKKTKNILSLILTYIGLEAYFKRARAAQNQENQKKSKNQKPPSGHKPSKP